jgi:hypothetical protein
LPPPPPPAPPPPPKDQRRVNAASSLNTFFSESTLTILDSKICKESALHWIGFNFI